MSSPTQRSLKLLRDRGYTCAVVERWNAHAKIRQDLFGFIDVLAIGEDEVIGVQACHASDVSKRIDKIANHDNVAAVRKAGIRILVHGWEKGSNGRYRLREEDIS